MQSTNIVSFDPKKYEHVLHEKMLKFEQANEKKPLDRCDSTLEIFLVKYISIFVLI